MPLTSLIPMILALGTVQTAPPPVPNPDIVVQHRTDASLAELVKAMTDAPPNTQVARWNDAICIRLLDLDDHHTSFIENRIAAIARTFGVTVIAGGCHPNIIILATADADAFAKTFANHFPSLLQDSGFGLVRGTELETFLAPRPVRWIDATNTRTAYGMPIGETNNGYDGGSLIHQMTRETTMGALVIVDMYKMEHIAWAQLADYIAFVTLARPKLTTAPPDSIMSIFAARDGGTRGPMRLTATDEALLRGLYHSDPTLSASMQRSQIADQVKKASR